MGADWQAMQNRRNYYRILHVQPDAPPELIRSSYRTLMHRMHMHPDLGGDHQQAVLINEAFDTLSDPLRRDEYDRGRADVLKNLRQERAATAQRRATKAAEEVVVPPTNACPFCGAAHTAHAAHDPFAVCYRCDSPLCRVTKEAPGENGRRLDRMPRNLVIDVHPSGAARAFRTETDDISINGARFLSAAPMEPGQRLKLDCGFCAAIGVVRHARVETDGKKRWWRVGVEFLTLLIKQPRGAFVSTQA